MVKFGRHSLDYLSHDWPGVPYPYEKTTEFQGGADMEYPMMVNDKSTPTRRSRIRRRARDRAHLHAVLHGHQRNPVRVHG